MKVEWLDDLIWCPSQCYAHIKRNDIHYMLYLRWRWDDPWEAYIIKNAYDRKSMHNDDAEWSEDLFEKQNLYFKSDELDKAKEALLDIFAATTAS